MPIGARHPSLRRLRRLSRQRSARSAESAFVIDGPKLLGEALAAGTQIELVVAEPDVPRDVLDRVEAAGATVHEAPAGTLARFVDTVTPQPAAAIARFDDRTVGQALEGLERPELVLVLVGVNDPGNAGTLVRSAEAAGVGAVVFCDESVDPYNPKCVRAAAGSLFRTRVVRSAASAATVETLLDRGVRCVGAAAGGGTAYDQIEFCAGTAIVLGSEAHGLADDVVDRLDELATIPMRNPVESLNVAMAGTLLCFEAARQRRESSMSTQGIDWTTPRPQVQGAAQHE